MRPIDTDNLLADLYERLEYLEGRKSRRVRTNMILYHEDCGRIMELRSVLDRILAVPIFEAKTAEWLPVDIVKSFGTIHGFRCSFCEKETVRDYPHCPHCGAKMTIKDTDDDG